jgi:hydroxyethylthiazole kinase-like uncharacterized protein yjeF
MLKVFSEVNTLDKRCYDEYGLSEDILMENAAIAIKEYIEKKFSKNSSILVVSGCGNNGADGIALARMLHKIYDIKLYLPLGVKSDMAKLQLKRAKAVGVHIINDVCNCDVVVDALFGSGLNKELKEDIEYIVDKMSELDAHKIACDIPTGIYADGIISSVTFDADTTITMGAYKKALFLDQAKDYVGEIIVADLGVSAEIYEGDTNYYLLEKSDISLPFRHTQDTHKGTFGHLVVVSGDKEGASIISSLSARGFGVGLCTLLTDDKIANIPYDIMHTDIVPKNVTAIALGMGLGHHFDSSRLKEILSHNVPYIIDADMFYRKEIIDMLSHEVVITPHPKEFVALLDITSTMHIDIYDLQNNRFKYLEIFSYKYPNATIVLKGANTLIAKEGKIYICDLGSSRLSFGGSGDVLAGLIGSLLAQRYEPLDAAITAVLTHAIASDNIELNSYALSTNDLIDSIKKLQL